MVDLMLVLIGELERDVAHCVMGHGIDPSWWTC